jgi:type IV pilus assembly protein PilO
MMGNLQNLRRKFMVTAAVLVALDLAALVFLFTPLGRTRKDAQLQYDTARVRLRSKLEEVAPLRGMDNKLVVAKEEIADFYNKRVPAEGSTITAELGKLANENRVHITQGRYDTDDTDVPGLQQVRIAATLDGDYLAVVKFINALERDKMFFIVDSVTLGQEQGGSVRLNLRLESYVKQA